MCPNVWQRVRPGTSPEISVKTSSKRSSQTDRVNNKNQHEDIKKPLIILQKRLSAVYSPFAGRQTNASCFTNVKTQLGQTRGVKAVQTRSMRFTACFNIRQASIGASRRGYIYTRSVCDVPVDVSLNKSKAVGEVGVR